MFLLCRHVTLTVTLAPLTVLRATVNHLVKNKLIFDLLKNLFTEAKPARTISIISGGLKNDFAEIDRWEFVKGI